MLGSDLELCLDFTDTVDWRTSSHAGDQLRTYSDLLDWSKRKGVLGGRQVEALRKRGANEGPVMADARRLREAIYRTFSAVAHEKRASPSDIGVLNEYLAKGLARAKIGETDQAYGWEWRDDASLDMMLFPIASSAAMLLTSEDLSRVRECANEEEGCGSLFLDCSKSQSRRWCSMKSCGNRVKSKTFYDRHLRAKAH
jgi:predicted RNA-binding Zn ribbon-like protein